MFVVQPTQSKSFERGSPVSLELEEINICCLLLPSMAGPFFAPMLRVVEKPNKPSLSSRQSMAEDAPTSEPESNFRNKTIRILIGDNVFLGAFEQLLRENSRVLMNMLDSEQLKHPDELSYIPYLAVSGSWQSWKWLLDFIHDDVRPVENDLPVVDPELKWDILDFRNLVYSFELANKYMVAEAIIFLGDAIM